jgi:dGTPase
MPIESQQHVSLLESVNGGDGRARGVADYIAGMTDRYAIAEYERTFNPAL